MEDYFDGPEWNLRRLEMEAMSNLTIMLPEGLPFPIGRNDPSTTVRKEFYLKGLSDPFFDPNKTNLIGHTPMTDAIANDMGIDLVIALLKHKDIDVNACSRPESISPLMWASVSSNISYLLALCKSGPYSKGSGVTALNHNTPKISTLAVVEREKFDVFDNLDADHFLSEKEKEERREIIRGIYSPDKDIFHCFRRNKEV